MLAKIIIRRSIYWITSIASFGFYTVISCYLYEQVLFEVFLGNKTSYYREWELLFISIFFPVLSIFLPLFVFLKSKIHRNQKIKIYLSGTVIPTIFVLLTSFTNLCFELYSPLKIEPKLEQANAIVVGDLGNFYIRSFYASKLYHEGYADKIIVFAPRRIQIEGYLESELRIPQDAVIWGRGKGRINTFIESVNLSAIMKQQNWTRVLVVSDPYHIFRLTKTLEVAGIPEILPAEVPIEYYKRYPLKILGLKYINNWTTPLEQLTFWPKLQFRHEFTIEVLHEYVGLLFYWFKFYI